MTIEHFADGKIVAHHRVTDLQALLTQLAAGAR
jgi:predicted ester cyclase